MIRFPANNDSPIPLPLGMKLSQLITRKKFNFAADSYSDSRNELVENCPSSNIISRIIEKHEGSPREKPVDWRVRENRIPVLKSNSMMGHSPKKREFCKNYGLNLAGNLKQRSLDTYKHLCGSNNTRRITKKSLVYQDLYARQKMKQKEHRDIENFQRLYIDNLYRSPAPAQPSEPKHNNDESPSFSAISQFPSTKTSYNNDNTFTMHLANESEQTIKNSVDENCDTSSFFTPQTFAAISTTLHRDSIPLEKENNEWYLQHGKEVPSTEDLFRNECGLRNKFSNSWKQQNAGHNGQYSSYSPANIYENELTGAGAPFYSNADSLYFANSLPMNGQNAEPDKNLICCNYSNSPDEDSVSGEFSYSPDKSDYPNEKYSNWPEKIVMNDNYTNSSIIYSQNSNENMNLNDASQYSFCNQNSSPKTPSPEPKFLKEKNLTPLICYPERDGTVIIEKLRM